MSAGGVVVAIPTFHRPAMLGALLTDLQPQAAAVGARVLVIDNDPEGSGRDPAADHAVDYVVEPARGLAAVRNRAIAEAVDESALVFIDDDELPSAEWLATLIACWRDTGASAVSGRVETRFPADFTDPWIHAGGFFRRVRLADGANQSAAPTNNLLLDLDDIRRHGLRFDEKLGLSGGEDILFTKQLVKEGGVIVSCPSALVYDIVDPARLTRRWVLRRAYRVGITTVRTDQLVRGGLSTRARSFTGGVGRMLIGGGRWAMGELVRSPRHSARGARAAWRGAGMAMGSFGVDYQEYAKR